MLNKTIKLFCFDTQGKRTELSYPFFPQFTPISQNNGSHPESEQLHLANNLLVGVTRKPYRNTHIYYLEAYALEENNQWTCAWSQELDRQTTLPMNQLYFETHHTVKTHDKFVTLIYSLSPLNHVAQVFDISKPAINKPILARGYQGHMEVSTSASILAVGRTKALALGQASYAINCFDLQFPNKPYLLRKIEMLSTERLRSISCTARNSITLLITDVRTKQLTLHNYFYNEGEQSAFEQVQKNNAAKRAQKRRKIS